VLTNLAAPQIIRHVFGHRYVQNEAISALAILVWTMPILAWRRHGQNALLAIDRQRDEFSSSLIGIVLLIGLIFPLTYRWATIGTSLAIVASEFVAAGLAWCYLWYRIRRHSTE
jgi:O-antigen/teichoic acid export membrane protein